MNTTDSTTTELTITGMRCAGCVDAVTQALSAVSGVAQCEVNLDTGIAKVIGTAPDTLLVAAVRKAGFDA